MNEASGFAMPTIRALLLLSILGIISVQEPSAFAFSFSLFSQTCSREKDEWIKGVPGISQLCRLASNAAEMITEEILQRAFENLERKWKKIRDSITFFALKGKVINSCSRKADINRNRNFNADPVIHEMEEVQLPFEFVTEQLYRMFNFSRDIITNLLPYIDVKVEIGTRFSQVCMKKRASARCDVNSKYRTINGQCNNLQNHMWGSAMSCQPRLLPANYVGTSGFRISVNGEPLPGPRELSLNMHYHYDKPTFEWTHMYVFFGQLLDHDIALTPVTTTNDNQAIQCCPAESENHPQCAPILVPRDDPFYSQFNISCINFVRSVTCPTCRLGPRQSMNEVTSFIDASFIYGNTENETQSLRENDGTGKLRTYKSAYGDLLPQSSRPESDSCSFSTTNDICFESGDSRVNQHTVLASLHTIFHREHNRIASALKEINPHWDEETLFQETRRIVGAQMQAITYKEYLPITLGNRTMSFYKLWPGRNTLYNPTENPTTSVEFSTAAFRFGHSLVNSIVANRPLNASNETRYLRNEFFQPFELYEGLVDPILAGAIQSPTQQFDRHLVPDVTNYLYRTRGEATGLDLAAINIYRGRDHGLPTYVDTIHFCFEGQIRIRNFYDLVRNNLMLPEQAKILQNNYRFVQDVDLWPGILSEMHNEGAVVGRTAACIISLQFRNLKYGDRFYFEHRGKRGSFTHQQLRELRKVTLSQIICLNTKIRGLPKNAMLHVSKNNPYLACNYLRGINLSHWKE